MRAETERLMEAATTAARLGGLVLRKRFGAPGTIRPKESQASVVSDADLASERIILDWLGRHFPDDGWMAEESGFQPGRSGRLWVIDPLDGTSNFVAGLPWFGVMVAAVEQGRPVAAAAHLPLEDSTCQAGQALGAWLDGEALRLSDVSEMKRLLLAYSFDPASDPAEQARQAATLIRLGSAFRNVRSTNCLLDFLYTLQGRFGACVNQATRVWDLAAPWLLFAEADGMLTLLDGRPVPFDWSPKGLTASHAVLGCSRALHPRLLALLQSAADPARG